MLRAVKNYFAPPPIEAASSLHVFLSGEASYLAQRSTYEFCRNTLAYFGQWVFDDERFNDAFRICRWEAFAAILADMIMVADGHFRAVQRDGETGLIGPLQRLQGEILRAYPLPTHRPQGWADVTDRVGCRLAQARLAAPAKVGDIARTAARRIYDVLPLYSENQEEDFRVIENAIRFGLIAFDGKFRTRVRSAAVVADLLRDSAEPGLSERTRA